MYRRYCELRDLKELTDTQVAEYCGFSKSTLSDWKSGKGTPKLDKIAKIAECLGVSIDFLATGKEPESAEFTKEAELLVKIRNDKQLFCAIEMYYTLTDRQRAHVLDLIAILSEAYHFPASERQHRVSAYDTTLQK